MILIENLRRRIEEEGQLYIPEYVSERVRNCINDLGWSSYTDDCINDAWEELKREYRRISEGDRITAEELYRTECHIIAYLRYYFFLNYPVIRWILQKNLENGIAIIPRNKVVKILDFGAGPGTASMAISDFLEDARGIGIYENAKIKLYFDEGRSLFGECYKNMLGGHERVESIRYIGEIGYRENFCDAVIISYVLSELDNRMRRWYLIQIQKCLRNGGYLIIIESAYRGVRKYVWDFLRDREIRENFRIVYASGPLCSEQSCGYWHGCCHNSVKEKDLRTPEEMTEEMKRFFEATRQGKVKFVCCVLEKIKGQGGFADPSELREYRRDEEIKLRGWVIKRTSTERAENITLCSGLGRCNLAFWRERKVFEQVGDVSEGDILWIEGDYSGSSFNDLHSVYVSRIIEHIKK